MDNSKATATFFLDTRRTNKKSKFPVKLTIYHDKFKKRYATHIDLTQEEWLKLNSIKLKDTYLKGVKQKMTAIHEKADQIISQIQPFTFVGFEQKYYAERQARRLSNLENLFDEYIEQLKANDQVATAASYRTTKNSLNEYKKGINLLDVNRDFLSGYMGYLEGKGLSPTSVSINLRQLRCILNQAIDKGLMKSENYPFRGFSIPTSRNVKKALNESQLKALLTYKTNDIDKRKALDFWLFSYISNGMNMKDICLLKPENFHGDFFHFYRAKTKNTRKKDLRPIKVALADRTTEIIQRWRNQNPENPYLFPILAPGLNASQIMYKVQNFIDFVNKQMRLIGQGLKIDANLNTYTARHSHATILMRKGVPTAFIKESLGHASQATTDQYLSDFPDEDKQKYANLLTFNT